MVRNASARIKSVVATILFLLILLFIIQKTEHLFERKYSYTKYYDFYNQKQDFDVLFLGTSHVINAIYPMELWRDYGIVSYNLANHSENICTNYWQLVNALEYTTPKVVVVDLYAVDNDSKVNLTYLHNFTDYMPMSLTKIRMAIDLLEPSDWPEYLFELSLYHSRWEELDYNDIHPITGLEKGAELRSEVAVDVPPELIPKQEYDSAERLNKQYLQRIIDLCKQKQIDIILTYVPYSMPPEHQTVANWGYVIAEKNEIPYINFVYEDFPLNYATDCADIGHHLNASGAKKVTDYIGKFIKERYNISDKREDAEYTFWYQDYEEYKRMKIRWLNEQQDTWSYLLLLNDKDYITKIYAVENATIYQDLEIMELLNNINVFGKVEYISVSDDNYEGNFQVEVLDTDTNEIISNRRFTRIEENIYDTY